MKIIKLKGEYNPHPLQPSLSVYEVVKCDQLPIAEQKIFFNHKINQSIVGYLSATKITKRSNY